MNRRLIFAAVLLLGVRAASAHRLDEYLQATLLSVEKDHIEASMRMIPGVAVSSAVIASIDTNGDGVFSQQEQRTYAEHVLDGLSFTIDGESVRPKLVSLDFPELSQMKEGLGEIHLKFTVDIPSGGAHRAFMLENHFQNQGSVYLVNAVVPRDPAIQVIAQKRNQQQTVYELDYEQNTGDAVLTTGLFAGLRARISGTSFASLFRLGMKHIAEGTDHLLFLLTLLLPAPLLLCGTRWGAAAPVSRSLLHILKIVTAFTLGHSITLALAAFGVVHLPSRPVEALIAVSILISAVHTLRPIFPGRESWIAAFFGLVHGLAFASVLGNLGLGWWERASGVLAFNLGIETMQMIVVAVTLPSLLLLSRTRAYRYLRVGGGLFAGGASIGWIVERTFGIGTSVDVLVNLIAQQAGWIACVLFVASVICWWFLGSDPSTRNNPSTFAPNTEAY